MKWTPLSLGVLWLSLAAPASAQVATVGNVYVVPTDVSTIAYPDFYRQLRPQTISIDPYDAYCRVSRESVFYPASYLDATRLPPIDGAPFPPDVGRLVVFKDFWLQHPGENPTFCPGSAGPAVTMRDAYVGALQRAKALGADEVAVTTYASINDPGNPVVDFSDPRIPEADFAFIADQARQRGLKVFLFINVPPVVTAIPSRAWYTTFINSYADFIVWQAGLAQKYGLAAMMLNNLDFSPDLRGYYDIYNTRMTQALRDVRAVYSGKLVLYDSFWYSDLSDVESLVQGVDYIVVDPPSAQVPAEHAGDFTLSYLRGRYQDWFAARGRRYARFNKPLLLRTNSQSHTNYLVTGWVEEGFCLPGCPQLTYPTDFAAQALSYEAFFEAAAQANASGAVRVGVVGTDGYWYSEQIMPPAATYGKGMFPNLSQNIRDKPAESITYAWFGGAPAAAPGPPSELTASSLGSAVTLSWRAPTGNGTPTGYVIEAGSSSGAANLATLSTGNTATAFSTTGVPTRTYFVRVRATNAQGTSPPSNEALLVVTGGGCSAPGTPDGLTVVSNAGGTIVLVWNSASGLPTSYVVEAGSASGTTNLSNVDSGGPVPTLTTNGVARGTYYIRVRAKNACGVSGPSNEVVVVVQ